MEDKTLMVRRCKTRSHDRSEPRAGPRQKNQGADARARLQSCGHAFATATGRGVHRDRRLEPVIRLARRDQTASNVAPECSSILAQGFASAFLLWSPAA